MHVGLLRLRLRLLEILCFLMMWVFSVSSCLVLSCLVLSCLVLSWRLLNVSGCHFDAGFAKTITEILNLWFDEYFPLAYQVGKDLAVSAAALRLDYSCCRMGRGRRTVHQQIECPRCGPPAVTPNEGRLVPSQCVPFWRCLMRVVRGPCFLLARHPSWLRGFVVAIN